MDDVRQSRNRSVNYTGVFQIDEYRREALKIASLLLSYPESSIGETLQEIRDWAAGLMPAAKNFQAAAESLLAVDMDALRRIYVETFDFDAHASLALTAHEYGDSRERGTALIKLLRTLARSGFLPANGELADAAPVLLEYLAEKPKDVDAKDLEVRLAALCGHLAQRLGAGHAYHKVFIAIGDVLPKVSQEQIENLKDAGASPDREEDMPYPVFYENEIADGMNELEDYGMTPGESFEQLGLSSEMVENRRDTLWTNSGG